MPEPTPLYETKRAAGANTVRFDGWEVLVS